MKKLLVTLLVAATSLNFVACGSSNSGDSNKGEQNNTATSNSDEKVTLKVQAEKDWIPYYEKVRDTIVEKYPNATIELLK